MQGTLKTRYDSNHFICDGKEEMNSMGVHESCFGDIKLAVGLCVSILVRSSVVMSVLEWWGCVCILSFVSRLQCLIS